MFDLLIKNGKIIDGSGADSQEADLGLQEGKIKAIGNLKNEKAEKVIDARGKFVCPGFIDVGNHSDTFWRIFTDPRLESLVRQGITTIVGGNCGSSLAPLINREALNSIQKWTDIRGLNVDWSNMEEYLELVGRMKLAVNFGTLIGQSTLRRGILRDYERDLAPRELEAARRMVSDGMKQGALGISTGLAYSHAKKTDPQELAALIRSAAKSGGIYATHLRDESEGIVEAVREAVQNATAGGARLHISHFKVVRQENWHLQREALRVLKEAKANGLAVSFDVFPYAATGSVLYTLLPDWVAAGGKKLMVGRLKDSALRGEIIEELREKKYDYAKITVSVSPLSPNLNRKNIAEIASFQGKAPEEALLDVLVASDGRGTAIMEFLDEKNVEKALAHPLAVVSSDGAGYGAEHRRSGDLVHPRSFGAFPRVLARYVRERRILSWEEAVHRMTGKSASLFGIADRGLVRKDYWGDLVIFDPEKISDRATLADPYRYPEGIEGVVVNGEVLLENGRYHDDRRAGMIIRGRK